MPEDGVAWLPKDEILTFEEIAQVVQAATQIHGIRRFKLTGGEPTVRSGLVDLVAMLKRIEGVEDLSLTTNGQRLVDLAEPLRDAGLDRLTVSIDSLDPNKFRRITRTGDLAVVLAGLDSAERAGFDSIKINCVTMRGINDDELADFARLTHCGERSRCGSSNICRWAMPPCSIMWMRISILAPRPDAATKTAARNRYFRNLEAREMIERDLGPLLPIDRQSEAGVGPASVWQLAGGEPLGRIGFISAMSAPFCATCNRLRLTADGLLRSCLFDGGEVDIKIILRNDHSGLEALARAMTECVRLKPAVHSGHGGKQMSRIGG